MIFSIEYTDGKEEQIEGESYEKSEYWITIHSGGRYCKNDKILSAFNVKSVQVT